MNLVSQNKREVENELGLERIDVDSNLRHLVQKVLNWTHRPLAAVSEHQVHLLHVCINLHQILVDGVEKLTSIRLQLRNQGGRISQRQLSARSDAVKVCNIQAQTLFLSIRPKEKTERQTIQIDRYLCFSSNCVRKCCSRDWPLDSKFEILMVFLV